MSTTKHISLCVTHLILASIILGAQLSWANDEPASEDVDFTTDVSIDFDGFSIDPNLVVEENIDASLRSREEHNRETSTRHPFEKSCPYGFFTCNNAECIAMKWRCDGHYDCDDFSDELNCTTLDIPQHGSILPAGTTYVPPPPRPTSGTTGASSSPSGGGSSGSSSSTNNLMYGLDFNSTTEPLMIFSTGSSIRGLWMKSRVYFDVITRNKPHSAASAQPSITDAFSLFFGILGGGVSSASTGAVSAKPDDSAPASKPETTIVGLDMDPNNKQVMWVELGKEPGVFSQTIDEERISARRRRQQSGPRKVVEYGLLSPEDIALDIVGRNAYITDAGLPAVVVCSYVHINCKIIVQENIHKPRAIVADSTTGWVTFSDWGDHPGIFLVSMDGRRRETLVESDVVWPNGLALDLSTNSLYWADARLNKIERVDLKTRKREIIIKEVNTNPFSVSVFENRIYWSDWSRNDIKTCNKFTGNDTRVVMHADDIYGIHIYHPDLHRDEREIESPCWSKHCSHMCLLAPGASTFAAKDSAPLRATCACPENMALSAIDKATCMDVEMPFVIMNVRNYVAEVWPNRIGLRVIEQIISSDHHAIQDASPDWHNYKIYFYDAGRREIFVADFSERHPSLANVTQVEGHFLRGLTFDGASENLYWLDNQEGTLVMYSIRGNFKRTLRHNLARPTSMVLDTKNRVLYLACMDNTNPHILRTDMTANEESDVIIASPTVNGGLGLPISLHLNEQLQRLYWADAKAQTIESIDLDVKSHTSGIRPMSRKIHRRSLGLIVGFTCIQDSFLWTLSGDPYLYKARMVPGKNSRLVTFKMPRNRLAHSFPDHDYRRLITVDPRQESLPSACHTSTCSHGCLLDSTHEPRCVCPEGMKLSILNRTNCIEVGRHEEPIVIPAAAAALRAANLTRGPTAHQAVVPGAGVALSNIIKHLDSQTPAPSTSAPPPPLPVKPLGPPEHKKLVEDKHDDWIFEHSLEAAANHRKPAQEQHGHHHHEEAAAAHSDSAAPSSSAEGTLAEPARGEQSGNKMVWLIVFLLILSATGLVTVLSLLMLHKQGRLPRQVAVSFIAPGGHSSTFGGGSGQDKDRTMLLLDTDN